MKLVIAAGLALTTSLLAIDKDTSEESVRFNLHSWGYYQIAKGGWGPYVHAYPSYNPVVYRALPWGPEQDLRGREVTTEMIERAAACYDYLLIWCADEADVARADAHFEAVYHKGNLDIWRNRAGLKKSPPAASPACLIDEAPLHGPQS